MRPAEEMWPLLIKPMLRGVAPDTWQVPPRGLLGVLDGWRTSQPRTALQVIGGNDYAVSFEQLLCGAQRAALRLVQAGLVAGDRVLLSLEDPVLVITWFLGSIGRGMIPVILAPARAFGAKERHTARLLSVLRDCTPRAVVEVRAARGRGALDTLRTPQVIDARLAEGSRGITLVDQAPDWPAFLQYTSGSTGDPRGVVVTHGNLVANLSAISGGMGALEAERMLTWLPLHHDMGLVGGVLWPMFVGGTAFIMSPTAFISRPSAWLKGIAQVGATITVAPNFAYSICAHKLRDAELSGIDLGTLRLALCGAEPIDAQTVARFEERFRAYGLRAGVFYPVYGLAEATLAVAFPDPGRDVAIDVVDRRRLARTGFAAAVSPRSPDAQRVVSVGRAVPGHSVNIRDEATGASCADRHVGQVHVRGPSVSPRYWSEGPYASRSEVATGDLGYVVDGRLHIVDRIKDLVIVGGENYSPSDMEAAVAGVPGVRAGRVVAFAIRRADAGTELAVVVAEVDVSCRVDPRLTRREIAAAVRARVGIEAMVVLVGPGAIEKTTSGKLRRKSSAKCYEMGGFQPIEDGSALARVRRRLLYDRLMSRLRSLATRLLALRPERSK